MPQLPHRSRSSARVIVAMGATVLFLVGSSALVSCARPASAADVNVVTVVATDFAFEVRDTIPAGRTQLRLENKGPDLHHVSLVRLAEGKTMADLVEAVKQPGPPPAWITEVGGPNTPRPGGEANATLDLAAGRYALLCFIPAKDGQPHIMKGMMKEIVVVPPAQAPAAPASDAAGAAERQPDLVMTLDDYKFDLSAPITAGTRTIRVRNAAAQPHEVLVARLAPGATAQQLLAYIEKPGDGPPPAEPLGGTTAMGQGIENDVTIDFTPGEYAFICFVPDAKDGKPHFVHGMVRQLTVN